MYRVKNKVWRRQNFPITHHESKIAAPKPELNGKRLKMDLSYLWWHTEMKFQLKSPN
jgi:hypothetical protein